MQVRGTTVVTTVVVETTKGWFKVWENGTMEQWFDDPESGQVSYRWFDEGKYSDEDMAQVRAHAKKALSPA